ncbi:GTPase HflX [Shouchella lonarensis]|uniref:GTPase HflX n=1 Tax=Shouchella lonarensis TaxID=1464122 RepID=A0A1G6P7V9_9BACI|nr:GTPase HflX [Shouchella lonarensis]SDC75507.1 GTP-binding protein HflX [Shouchella lonarensis]
MGDNQKQSAIIVGIDLPGTNDLVYEMQELDHLTEALDLETIGQLTQKLSVPNRATYIGKGKVRELQAMCEVGEATIVVFNDELSPSQIRNLESLLEVTVYDRTMLVVDIFAKRAQTKEAQMQVLLAQSQYLLPRLVGMRASLSRQGGSGVGLATRGGGETKLELDRRKIETRMQSLKRDLAKVDEQREEQRKKRKKQMTPLVALVGYTNAGKSSLMNAILRYTQQSIEKAVLEKDMLFATLDTSVRQVSLNQQHAFFLADTVGFVSKLPHHLVKAFRSTLSEAKDADLLLHVVDYTHEHYLEMMKTTDETLASLGIDQPRLHIFNKIDQVPKEVPRIHENELFLSAKTGEGLPHLFKRIEELLYGCDVTETFLIPYNKPDIFAEVHQETVVQSVLKEDDGWRVQALLRHSEVDKWKDYQSKT